jgi:hypothetical protein
MTLSSSVNFSHAARKPIKVEFIIGYDRMWEDQEGLHIAGVLSIPRASLNGWIYLPEELALQDGKTVEMYFEHEETFNPNATPIGKMNVFWNPDLLQLNYEAIVTDKEKIALIKNDEYKHVSMGATWEGFDLIRGWLLPKGTEIVEGSLVKIPGIPEASVSIIDHVRPMRARAAIDSVPYLIPTKPCDMKFCNAILGSHKAVGVKPTACDKKMDEQEKIETVDVTASQDNISTPDQDTRTDSKAKEQEKVSTTDNSEKEGRKFVVIDANGMKLILKENAKMVIDSMREVMSPLQKMLGNLPKPQPTAMVTDGAVSKDVARKKFYDALNKAFKQLPNSQLKSLDWDFVNAELKKDGVAIDALTTTSLGSAAGKQWLEDITVIPAGLAAGIRNTCEVVIIERGAEEAIFTLITTPDPVDGTEATAPSDVTQTISTVTAKPVERVIKQTVSDQAIRKTPTNLAESLALSYRQREILDEDDKTLTELNNITVGNLAADIFGGNATAENQIDSGDTFAASLLAKAKRAIARKGWSQAYVPGGLVCVISPEQHEQLITDSGITRFVETVNEGAQLREGMLQRVHGIDIFVSSKVPTGTGAGTPAVTTHRAFVYARQVAMGLAFTKELAIETDRDINKRATDIVATWEIAAKNKRADAVARIVTYGSG